VSPVSLPRICHYNGVDAQALDEGNGMLPTPLKTILNHVMTSSPDDMRVAAQRLHDHLVAERMPPEELRLALSELGFQSIAEFCQEAGIAPHILERWESFGVAEDMRQILTYMIAEHHRFVQAVEEFEKVTHVGLMDFLRGRNIL